MQLATVVSSHVRLLHDGCCGVLEALCTDDCLILKRVYRKIVIQHHVNITRRIKPQINAISKPLLVYLL